MRRTWIVLLALALAACAAEAPERTEPENPLAGEEPDAISPTLENSTCENVTGGNPENFPSFVEVELEQRNDTDAITFRFEPEPGAPEEPPLHFINFTDELITDGEGRPVRAEGEAFVVVSFQAVGVDLSGEEPVEVYTGSKRFTPGYGVLREAVHLGDFEGQVSWGLGLARDSCFRLDAARDHITLEFPNV